MKNCTIFEFSSVKLYLFHHNVTKYDLGLGRNREHSAESQRDLDLEPFLLRAQCSCSTYDLSWMNVVLMNWAPHRRVGDPWVFVALRPPSSRRQRLIYCSAISSSLVPRC